MAKFEAPINKNKKPLVGPESFGSLNLIYYFFHSIILIFCEAIHCISFPAFFIKGQGLTLLQLA